MGDKNFKWYVADSIEAEIFNSKHDTREEAIKEGYSFYGKDPFVIIEADNTVVKPTFNSDDIVSEILESLEENNQECWWEDGADGAWAETKQLELAIEKAVADWLTSHPPKTFCVDEFRTTEFFNGATT
ncbi:hypothetical protein [Rhizobium rhizogenes]|uniref:hypothetical protein n=1 Tax=Rhizobium rhizogenes TaxID=359 RepID=UPI001574A0F1|nr:hypothetical protein [Rhizobium rhizogenes]NTF69408.1 hypothetical protein [Rhizobium rhizogenes]